MDEKVKMENLTHEDRMKLFETTELYGLKILHMFYKKLAYNEDLQQEMRIARWQAALEYDPSRGINFTAFAKKRILERVSAECYRCNGSKSASQAESAGSIPVSRSTGVLPALTPSFWQRRFERRNMDP